MLLAAVSAESKELDEYLFGQLQSEVEGAFKTHLDSVRNRPYIEGMLILHNIERLSRVMDLMGMWDKFVDISVTGDVTEWYTSVLASWNDFNSRRITPEIFFLLLSIAGIQTDQTGFRAGRVKVIHDLE
jgi:hypothetical protein